MTQAGSTAPSSDGPNPSASADEIRGAARDASDTAKSALADAKAKLGEQGDQKIDAASTTAGESLRQVAEQLRQAGDNLGQDQGWAQQAFSQGAQGLERVSDYLRQGRLDDFARDVQNFARANPAAFLAGSVALGFFAARIAKTASEHASPSAPAIAEARPAPEFGLEEPRSFAPVASGASDLPRGDL